jgi:hypothetical protein
MKPERDRAMKKLLARIAARREVVAGGSKKYFAADFAKTAFSIQVVIEGLLRFLSDRKGGRDKWPQTMRNTYGTALTAFAKAC